MNELRDLLEDIFDSENLKHTYKIVLANVRKKSVPYKKCILRPTLIKSELMVQVEKHTENKVLHENLMPETAIDYVYHLLESDFKQMNVQAQNHDIEVLAAKIDKPRIRIAKFVDEPEDRGITGKKEKGLPKLQHNRKKNYVLEEGKPIDFLVKLGVMTKDGQVIPKHYSKFRQINKYLEIVKSVMEGMESARENRTIKIVDFGCGKSYLTFGLYYYLHEIEKQDVSIIGLDLKKDVIKFCNDLTESLGYENLRFRVGNIADYQDNDVDMVVSLHACDTATDYALANAAGWGARVILAVPCCQHELFNQISEPLHRGLYKHGILKDKFTEILTNGLRGLKLEACGYEVDMVEFTGMEHTAKNVMIRAIKKQKPKKVQMEEAEKQYKALCEYYHVKPTTDEIGL